MILLYDTNCEGWSFRCLIITWLHHPKPLNLTVLWWCYLTQSLVLLQQKYLCVVSKFTHCHISGYHLQHTSLYNMSNQATLNYISATLQIQIYRFLIIQCSRVTSINCRNPVIVPTDQWFHSSSAQPFWDSLPHWWLSSTPSPCQEDVSSAAGSQEKGQSMKPML